VNADAIAIISRIKNKFNDVIGNLRDYPLPNFCASFLSLINDNEVLTANVKNNFDNEGSIHYNLT
jgi:hypothetical protein